MQHLLQSQEIQTPQGRRVQPQHLRHRTRCEHRQTHGGCPAPDSYFFFLCWPWFAVQCCIEAIQWFLFDSWLWIWITVAVLCSWVLSSRAAVRSVLHFHGCHTGSSFSNSNSFSHFNNFVSTEVLIKFLLLKAPNIFSVFCTLNLDWWCFYLPYGLFLGSLETISLWAR